MIINTIKFHAFNGSIMLALECLEGDKQLCMALKGGVSSEVVLQ